MIRVTCICRNLSEQFYSGFGSTIIGLLNMSDDDKYAHLKEMATAGLVSMKIGHGQYREAVELNSLRKGPHAMTFKIEPRRGYKLATFEFTNVIGYKPA